MATEKRHLPQIKIFSIANYSDDSELERVVNENIIAAYEADGNIPGIEFIPDKIFVIRSQLVDVKAKEKE